MGRAKAKDIVDIRPLKRLVQREYSEDSPYRRLILDQPDTMNRDEYVLKLADWLKLRAYARGS